MYKKLIITCCLLFSTHAVAQKQALLIGVSDYGGDPRNDLMGIDLDIDKMHQLFKGWGFKVKVLYNQESLQIEDYLKSYANSLSANDTFAFYYTGHGSLVDDIDGDEIDDHKDEALVLSDGVKNIPYIDDNLNQYLNTIKAKKLIIFDSCHSGTAHRGDVDNSIRVKSLPFNELNAPLSKGLVVGREIGGGDYIVLSASEDNEESLATMDGSLFTNEIYRLLSGQNSLDSIQEEATYNIVSYAKRANKKPHHPKFTFSNPSFKNISMNSYLKTSHARPTHRQTQEQTLQSQLNKMVQNTPPITITNQQNRYHTGDFVNFTLNTNNQQGYLTILFVEKSDVTVLYPNPRASSRLVQGSYDFPKDFGNFKVKAKKKCDGCQLDKTSIYLMLTPQPLANIANMTQKSLLSFTKGSNMAKIMSKDVELVFDEPAKNSQSGLMMGKYEFFVD